MIKKSFYMIIGSLLFLIGMVLFPLPVPFGAPTMLIGLILMFKASNRVKRRFIRLFKKHPFSHKAWLSVRQWRKKQQG